MMQNLYRNPDEDSSENWYTLYPWPLHYPQDSERGPIINWDVCVEREESFWRESMTADASLGLPRVCLHE